MADMTRPFFFSIKKVINSKKKKKKDYVRSRLEAQPARASGFFGSSFYFSEGEKRRPEKRLRFAGYEKRGE